MAKFLISAFADEAHNGINGQVEALKRNGLFCIEPRAMNFGAVLAKTDEELAAIKKRFDDEGIIVPSFGSPLVNIKSPTILSLTWHPSAARSRFAVRWIPSVCVFSAFLFRKTSLTSTATRSSEE